MLLVVLCFICSARADSGIETWSALQEAVDRAGDGEIITLSEDLTALEADAQITVPEGKRLTIDLNGHVLDASTQNDQTSRLRCVIKINAGAILTLRDSGGSAPRGGSGVLTGGFHDNGGGILNRGTLIMEGGYVTGNTALKSSGGIANYGTMVLTGGSVTGNTALLDGSEVLNDAKGHLTVGGAVVFDSGEAKDGGICNEGTLTVIDAQSGEVHIEDTPIIKRFIAQLSMFPVAALLLTVWLDDYLGRERKRTMVVIITLVFILLFQNYWDNRLSVAAA